MTTTTVKMFIDVFIGVWSFVLALIWVYKIDRRPGDTENANEIWQRYPKFVLGYGFVFGAALTMAIQDPSEHTKTMFEQSNSKMAAQKESNPERYRMELNKFKMAPFVQAQKEADVFRTIFFAMTFFTIGMGANFKKLWAEGIGRLALVYVISLFGFVIWIGLAISWLFFHGVLPPMASGGS